MKYNSINEFYESLKSQINEAMEECKQEYINEFSKYAKKIKQNAENDLARIERGEIITEWIRE